MKYAVLKCINGHFSIHAEGFTELSKAVISYFGLCQILWNADDVITADVMLVDEHLFRMGNYYEHIDKTKKDSTDTPEFPI